MTASAHLAFPVYCLAFDKTGRYFVTGADDCLVKVFYIGAARSNASTQCTFSYGSNDHSAVLVCTLRGHAGVICDVDVSADNAFLATASDDGDVRVWGLKDGTPIAILRGHRDGANMVRTDWESFNTFL
jgi:PH-interacting protein